MYIHKYICTYLHVQLLIQMQCSGGQIASVQQFFLCVRKRNRELFLSLRVRVQKPLYHLSESSFKQSIIRAWGVLDEKYTMVLLYIYMG